MARRAEWRLIAPRPATREELLRVHSADYLDTIAAASGRAVMLDPDTFTSPESVEIAALAAGATVQAAEHARATSTSRRSRWCVRPDITPSATARWDSASITTSPSPPRTPSRAGQRRVAIVDIDVHHGNGTQWMFYDDPRVLYFSTHQFPFYPGTGAADEIGTGDGEGIHVQRAARNGCDRR